MLLAAQALEADRSEVKSDAASWEVVKQSVPEFEAEPALVPAEPSAAAAEEAKPPAAKVQPSFCSSKA